MRINTQVLIETPEGVDLQAEPAGIVVRTLAFCIDFAIRIAACFLVVVVFLFAGVTGIGMMLIVFFLVTWFYNVFFEVLNNGQTPGKKSLNIAVVQDDLTPVTWSTSMIRNLLRVADGLPYISIGGFPIPAYVVAVLTIVFSKNFRRLGDIAAGTLVVYRERETKRSDTVAIKEKSQPPPVLLQREDQIAFVGFAQRQQQLSDDRQQELANIVGPILPVDENHRVQYLRGIGAWLLGIRN